MTYVDFENLMKEFGLNKQGYLIRKNLVGIFATPIATFKAPNSCYPWKENAIIIWEGYNWTGEYATDVDDARKLISKRLLKEKEMNCKRKIHEMNKDFKHDL